MCSAAGAWAPLRTEMAPGRPERSAEPLPPPALSVLALWGLMNYFLQSGLLAMESSLVPRALWAAEHRAEAVVFVLLLATRSEFLRNGKAPAPVCRQ